jgi:hypothetical protein
MGERMAKHVCQNSIPRGKRTAATGSVRKACREGDLRELKTQIHTTRDSESFKLMKIEWRVCYTGMK